MCTVCLTFIIIILCVYGKCFFFALHYHIYNYGPTLKVLQNKPKNT